MRPGWFSTRVREQGVVVVTVWAVGVVRDEADIIESTVTRMLRQVDHVLVADNRSVDGTGEILRSFDRVTVVVDPDPNFEVDLQQARRTTALASLAGQRGADWVVPFDADEVWVARDGRRLGDVLDGLPDNILVARGEMVNHVVTERDPPGPDPPARMVYRRPEYHRARKVACRTRPGLWIVKGNHDAEYRGVAKVRRVDGLLLVHHYPARSAEQFVRKVRHQADGLRRSAPAAPNRLAPAKMTWIGILEEEGEDALVARFDEEHRFADPDAAGLVFDPCP
jgi:hypothetical protein